jgi:hypothetical protein
MILLSRKRWELFAMSWLLVVIVMVWPGRGQARFERLWWPVIPVLAGAGFVAMISMLRRTSLKIPSVAEWLDQIQRPLVIAFCVALITTLSAGFIPNAYATAERTTPPTEWHWYVSDGELMSAFDWIRENTPENSVTAIEWSFGHVFTGVARRMSVCDGTETIAEEGKWENTGTIHPPDYVYRVIDQGAQIFGIQLPRIPWAINGRRIDVAHLPLMDEREFLWLVQTYRDNYGCKIDYVLFYRLWCPIYDWQGSVVGGSYYGIWSPALTVGEAANWQGEEVQASSFVEEDENIIFEFEGRENVIYNPQTGEVFLQADGPQESLAGHVAFYWDRDLTEQGYVSYNFPLAIQSLRGFSFPSPTPNVSETLLLFYNEDGEILVWRDRVQAYLIELSVPMIVRVFSPSVLPPYNVDYLEGIDYYIQIVYESPGGQIKLCRINYVPQPISPADNASISDNTPTFRWSAAVGAVNYELWVDGETLENTSEVTYTPTENLTGENHSWKVRAYDVDNNATDWSPVWTFILDTVPPSAPALVSPENGAVENELAQTFTWTQPEPDVLYWIQVDDEASFSEPYVHQDWEIADNSYAYDFSRNGTYYWRVCARDAAHNWGPWSENYELTILAPAGHPMLASPADNALSNDNTPAFEWGPGSNADNHRLLVDNDNDFLSPEENVLLGATGSTHTVATENSLPDGSYSWKVIAINEVSENESAVWTFTIDTVPPDAPTLLAPDNGSTERVSTPTFDWSDVSDPSGITYELEVASDSEFTSLLIEKTGLTASNYNATAVDALSDGTYYWRVRARDEANNVGDFSPTWSFTVDTLT